MYKGLILFCLCALILPGFSCSDDPLDGNPQKPPSAKKLNTTPTAQPANIPVLAAGQMIKIGDNPITIGHTASPEIVDWNNDGKKDLILGTYITFPNPEEGKVMLYLNEGTDEEPVFKQGEFLSAAGEVISVGAGWCQGAVPRVVDWNEDGKKDLIVGDTNGFIYIYLNTGTDDAPVLAKAQLLQLAGETFNLGERAKPDIIDWNNDGKKDLITGHDNGDVFLMINTGTNDAPVFAEAVKIPIDAGYKPQPLFYDWNNDGKKDLLFADEYATVHYFENTGTAEKPSFADDVPLQADGANIAVGFRTRLDITDWNNDGVPDLLYGSTSRDDNQGYLYLYLSQKPNK